MSAVIQNPHNQGPDFDYDTAVENFTAPDSSVPGVTLGSKLKDNAPHMKGLSQADEWDYAKQHFKLVSPLNRKKFTVLVVGTGLELPQQHWESWATTSKFSPITTLPVVLTRLPRRVV